MRCWSSCGAISENCESVSSSGISSSSIQTSQDSSWAIITRSRLRRSPLILWFRHTIFFCFFLSLVYRLKTLVAIFNKSQSVGPFTVSPVSLWGSIQHHFTQFASTLGPPPGGGTWEQTIWFPRMLNPSIKVIFRGLTTWNASNKKPKMLSTSHALMLLVERWKTSQHAVQGK